MNPPKKSKCDNQLSKESGQCKYWSTINISGKYVGPCYVCVYSIHILHRVLGEYRFWWVENRFRHRVVFGANLSYAQTNLRYWPVSDTGQFKILASFRYWPVSGTNQFQVLASFRSRSLNKNYFKSKSK